MRAEYNLQSMLKARKEHKKSQAQDDELEDNYKRKLLTYKTPPPELAKQMYFKR